LDLGRRTCVEMPLAEEARKALTCDPGDYIYKSTISATENSWLMIYHFEEIKLDLEVRVYHLDHKRANKIFEYIRHLANVKSVYILSPEKVFNWCGELWLIFPLHIGRPLEDVLIKHYTNGITNERVTARILLDVLEALEVLHEDHLCHRGIATDNLFLDKETGITMLKDFTNIKLFDKNNARTTKWVSRQGNHLMPPEMLGYDTDEKCVDEKKSDIFLFAVTAMNLAYGSLPPNPMLRKENCSKNKLIDWLPPSHKYYDDQPAHVSDSFRAMLAPCLQKDTSKRPSAQELKKNRFFNEAASRNEVIKEVCSLFKIAELSVEITDVPPSQQIGVKVNSVRSGWDFSSITRQPTPQNVVEDNTSFKPSKLSLDDVDDTKQSHTLSPTLNIDSPDQKFLHVIHNTNTLPVKDGNLETSQIRVKQKSRFKVEEVPFDNTEAPPVAIKDGPSTLNINDVPKINSGIGIEQKELVLPGIDSPQVTTWETKKPAEWEIEDVCEWLTSLGGDFKDYTNFFRKAGIDGEMLLPLDDEELGELGVKKKIHRRRILTSIKKLSMS